MRKYRRKKNTSNLLFLLAVLALAYFVLNSDNTLFESPCSDKIDELTNNLDGTINENYIELSKYSSTGVLRCNIGSKEGQNINHYYCQSIKYDKKIDNVDEYGKILERGIEYYSINLILEKPSNLDQNCVQEYIITSECIPGVQYYWDNIHSNIGTGGFYTEGNTFYVKPEHSGQDYVEYSICETKEICNDKKEQTFEIVSSSCTVRDPRDPYEKMIDNYAGAVDDMISAELGKQKLRSFFYGFFN